MMLLSDEELREISKQKTKKFKVSTAEAKIAMRILWDRAGRPFERDGRDVAPGTEDQGYYEGVV